MTKFSTDMTRRSCLKAAGAALLVGVAGKAAFAQEKWPTKTIDIVTHSGAGGGTDVTARMAMNKARELLGVDIRIVNKQGGGGAVAMDYAMGQPKDGYTLMMITPSHLMTMAAGKARMVIDDMVGIVRCTDEPQFILAKKGKFPGGFKQVMEEGQKRAIKTGGTSVGGIDQVAVATMAKKGNFKINYVPYQGGGHILTSLIGGDIEIGDLNYSEAESMISAGEVVPLVALSEKRIPSHPDVPATGEFGVAAYFSTIRGLVAVKGTPADRVKALEGAFLKSMAGEEYKKYLKEVGLDDSSIADAATWDKQIRQIYKDGVESLTELGFIKAK